MEERTFPNTFAAVGAARRYVTEFVMRVEPAAAEIVTLLVSELATNSVRHADSDFVVGIEADALEIRVSVSDRGSGRPEVQNPQPNQPTGRGLRVVDALAESWSIVENPNGGKSVRFSVDRHAIKDRATAG